MKSPFSVLQQIAENRIQEAIEKGEFENLPGNGKPLELEDLSNVPEELRMAYKMLKNSGHLPPQLADRKEAASLLEMLENCQDEQEKLIKMAKLRLLAEKMGRSFDKNPVLAENDLYYQKILARLS